MMTLLSSFILLLLLTLLFPNLSDGLVLCKRRERDALLQFKNGFTRDETGKLSSWDAHEEENCCSWKGITCDNRTGHVIELILQGDADTDLDGNVLEYYMEGHISPSLLELKYIQTLELCYINFSMHPIPDFLGSFGKLMYLNLSSGEFFGRISFQLGNLSALETLDLSNNPALVSDGQWLSKLSSLRYLDLRSVNLSNAPGLFEALTKSPSISYIDLSSCALDPRSLSIQIQHPNFTRLPSLSLNYNYMEFRLPRWLLNMTRLMNLELGQNHIMRTQPQVTGSLCNLRRLSLSETKIQDGNLDNLFMGCTRPLRLVYLNLWDTCTATVHLPAWLEDCKSLEYLNIGSNGLSGSIPEFIFSIQTLQYLILAQNDFSGNLTEAHFFNLTRLSGLSLSSTGLNLIVSEEWVPPFQLEYLRMAFCNVGPRFPSWLQSQRKLFLLNMSRSGISDVIPQWIWDFSTALQYMDLSVNNLTGTVPTAVNVTRTFDSIILYSNRLEGFLSDFPLSRGLVLARNSISGPVSLSNPSVIEILSLASNQLTGTVPSTLCEAINLNFLDLSGNNLSGQLPPCLGRACTRTDKYSGNLEALFLYKNNLEGNLPPSLSNCKHLSIIDVSRNRFSGTIPSWISRNLQQLRFLDMASNSFHGDIPSQLSELKSLQLLVLSDNLLSGRVPPAFGNLSAMRDLSSFGNYNSGDTRITVGTINFLTRIDLSGNLLSGEIPRELGNLLGLVDLDLSRNSFTGYIPDCLGQLKRLEFLDLSRNNFFGGIPQSLSELTWLGKFNVSFNNLSARIPIGKQFNTFTNFSYIGNPLLCGYPLEDCKVDKHPEMDENSTSSATGFPLFYLGMPFGFVAGFWTFLGILILKRRWRYAYFLFLDSLSERVYLVTASVFKK